MKKADLINFLVTNYGYKIDSAKIRGFKPMNENWVQIPIAPMYEINPFGKIRNIKTGNIIKPRIPKGSVGNKQVKLYITSGGKQKKFHVSGLVYLVHGIIPKTKTHSRIPVPVIVSRGKNESYYFDSLRKAAQFLAKQIPLSAGWIHVILSEKHPKEFRGWRLNYQR